MGKYGLRTIRATLRVANGSGIGTASSVPPHQRLINVWGLVMFEAVIDVHIVCLGYTGCFLCWISQGLKVEECRTGTIILRTEQVKLFDTEL